MTTHPGTPPMVDPAWKPDLDAVDRRIHRLGVASLLVMMVLGLVALLNLWVALMLVMPASVLSLVLALLALRSHGTPAARAGRTCAWVAVGLAAGGWVLFVLVFAAVMMMMGSGM